MSFDLSSILNLFQSFFLLKIAFLVVIFLYVIFTFIVLNQVIVMNRAVSQKTISGLLTIIAVIHILLALSLFAFAIAIL